MSTELQEDSKLARLRAEAELEMRRTLPGSSRPAKRQKKGSGAAPAAGGHADGHAAATTAPAALGGRFDYGALKELPIGLQGFLLTCPLQRENSARKEVLPLLQRYLAKTSTPAGGADAARDPAVEATPAATASLAEQQGEAAQAAGEAAQAAAEAAHSLAAIKPRLAHVQRVVPVQTTCRMERAALEAAGARLAALVAAALLGSGAAEGGGAGPAAAAAPSAATSEAQPARKVTFGISLKQRALEGARGKPAAPTGAADEAANGKADSASAAAGAAAAPPSSSGGGSSAPLDRGAIISALAGGFEAALLRVHGCEVAVDLKQPGWVLVVEALPAAGELYAALCALPAELCVLKPKLHVKPVGKS
ncbi:hypothetical protein ABPG75_005407 [Micractinium tetrahymenae]